MKKRIATLLCTAVLSLVLTAAPAMASAGPFSYTETDTGLGLLFILSCAGGAVMAALCVIEAKQSPRRSQGAESEEENQHGVP